MKQILLSITLLIAVVTGAKAEVSGSWSDSSNRDETWGTDYESASTFTINSAAQLAQFAYLVNSGKDFSGKTVTLNDAQVIDSYSWGNQTTTYPYYDLNAHYWTPIGTSDKPFNGTFDSNNKDVYGVTINDEEANYQGFFGYIGENGHVIHLTLNANITGNTQVGAIAGYNKGTVEKCIATRCTITGSEYTGVIIGQNEGNATNCYSLFTQNDTKALGNSDSPTGEDSDGHAQCLYTVKGDEEDGFSIGFENESDKEANVTIGTPTGVEWGSVILYDDGMKMNAYHYYKTGQTFDIINNQQGYDVTFSVSGGGATISGNTVTVGTANITVSVASKTVAEWSGSGDSADDPYVIYTREQLDMLATRVNEEAKAYENKFFRLAAYINYDSKTYTPIGTAAHPFCGTFDGNGQVIKYANNKTSGSYQGLFGHIGAGGTVKNLQAESCYFHGSEYIGVIAGYNAGTIQNCRVEYGGNVTFDADEYSCFGTIAGFNKGTVSECVSSGKVGPYYNLNSYTNVTMAGGIVGHNTGTVSNCLYIGSNVIATAYVGAIVGHNDGGTLTNNYYHDNGIQEYSSDPITYGNVAAGTVKGVGTSSSITGSDTNDAKKANVVTFVRASSSYFNNSDQISIDATPSLVTTNNPNKHAYSVYTNGILFDDSYIGSHEMDRAFYTTATTVGLTYTQAVPSGYGVVFAVETGENSSISGSTLTISDDVVGVSATTERVVSADSWLAEAYRAESFSTTGENSITITSAAELGLLAYNVNFGGETYEGYTINIGVNEINLAGHTWEPIGYDVSGSSGGGYYGGVQYPVDDNLYGGLTAGSRRNDPAISPVVPGGISGGGGNYSSASGFLGTFDGGGHIISNMNVTGTMSGGLFNSVESGAIVKNIIITGAQVKGDAYVGVVAGKCSGTIDNCHVSYSNVEFGTESDESVGIGGIAGTCTGGSIKGCTVMGTNIYPAIADAMNIGGIVGGVASGSSIVFDSETETYSRIAFPAILQDCLFTGNIHKVEGNTYVGAIAGASQGDNTITNNYYVDGVNPYATPNTELKAINGADIEGGAERAYAYDQQPAGIGDVVTNYGYGMEAYTNVLHYSPYWYTPTAPVTMDITLSNSGDNSTLLSTYNGITGKVTLGGRSFNKNGLWYTICLPFTIDDINAKDGDNKYIWPFGDANVEVKQFTEASFNTVNGELSLTFEDCYDSSSQKTTLAAGNPYLIRWSNTSGTIENPVFNNVTITKTAPIVGDASNGVTFIGTFASQTFTEENRSILFLGAGKNAQNKDVSMLFFPQPDTTDPNNPIYPTIGACRAYFQLDGITAGDLEAETTVRSFVMNFGEGDSDATRLNDNGKMINDKEADAWYTLDGRKVVQLKKGLYIHNHRIVNIK